MALVVPEQPPRGVQFAPVDHAQDQAKGARGKKCRLRCPFRAHAIATRDESAYGGCNTSFPGCGPLNEHIHRAHGLRNWCLKCKTKARENNASTAQMLKKAHEAKCIERPWGKTEKDRRLQAGLMSEEQFYRFVEWKTIDIPRFENEKTPLYNWRKIYQSLFKDTEIYPSPYDEDDTTSESSLSSRDDHWHGSSPSIMEDHPSPLSERMVDGDNDILMKSPDGNYLAPSIPEPMSIMRSPYSGDFSQPRAESCAESSTVMPWSEITLGPGSQTYSSNSGGGQDDAHLPGTPPQKELPLWLASGSQSDPFLAQWAHPDNMAYEAMMMDEDLLDVDLLHLGNAD